MQEYSKKSRAVAAILCFLFGVLGVHRFYIGKAGTGVLMIVFTITGIGIFISGIWAFCDFIMILCGQMEDKQHRIIKNWND